MNIAMITNNYKPFIGGVPISIERLSETLIKMGHNVYVFAPSYDDYNIIDDENTIRYKSFGKIENGFNLPNILDRNIEEEFHKLDIDVIHVHHPIFAGNIAQRLSKKYDIPLIYTYHTRYEEYVNDFKILEKIWKISLLNSGEKLKKTTKEKLIPWFIKSFSEKCSMVIAPSNSIKQRLVEFGVDEANVKVVPTGLLEHNFNYDDKIVNEVVAKYKKDKKYMFCTVTRLAKEKNIHFLINAMHSLKNDFSNDFVLLVIGDGPLKSELVNMVKELDLEDNIAFVGNVENDIISNYYRACDLFLFSSTAETQGMVLSEAMAQDTPVVAVKSTGIMDVIKNGYNGFETKEDVLEFNKAITKSLLSPELYNKLQKGANKTADEYKCINIAEKMCSIYRKSVLAYKKDIKISVRILKRLRA